MGARASAGQHTPGDSGVLVTGGAGFIGAHVVERLLRAGRPVTVVDDLSRGSRANIAAASAAADRSLADLYVCDVADAALEDAIAASRPRTIVHLAAQIDVRRSVAAPLEDARANVLGTVNLLETARRHGVDKVVFITSGGCIYGEPDPAELPIDEQHPGHPASPYGAGKRAAEEYLHCFAALYGLRWTSLALANVYGPRQDPGGEAGVVAIFGSRMLADEPVLVFGDGEQTRDFVSVDDVVDAVVAAMEAGDGLRLHIGSGVQTSVLELFARMAELTGYTRPPEHRPARTGELRHIALDWGRAQAALGWSPRTTLADGLAATLQWLRESARSEVLTPRSPDR